MLNKKTERKGKRAFFPVEFPHLSVALFKVSAFEGFGIGLWSWIPGLMAHSLGGKKSCVPHCEFVVRPCGHSAVAGYH